MGTTVDKLNKLLETKQAIKTAIINKGVEVSESDTFRSYADKINNISSGGSGDVIQAINNTGSIVNLDDRVWITKDVEYGYKATLNVSNDALTGFAKTSVENGGFFDVNIILPKEITAFITVDVDNAYIGVE